MSNAAKLEQLSFESKIIQPRQNRYPDEVSSVLVEFYGATYSVRNYSRFGLGIVVDRRDKKLPEKLEIIVRCSELRVYEGGARVIYRKKMDDEHDQVGIELDDELPVERIMGMNDATNVIDVLATEVNSKSFLKPEFVEFVEDLSSYLTLFKSKVEENERRIDALPLDQKNEYLTSFRYVLANSLERSLTNYSRKLDEIISIAELKKEAHYVRYLRERLASKLEDADIVRRLLSKPLGYSGDFETINQIWRRGFEGKSLFGHIVHHSIVNSYPSRVVQLRSQFFTNELRELVEKTKLNEHLNVLAVSVGPALELQKLVSEVNAKFLERAEFHVLDVDSRSLMYAQAKLSRTSHKAGRHLNSRFVCCTVSEEFRTRRESLAIALDPADHLENYDLIYVPYLCDYLDTNMCTVLARKLSAALKPTGKLVLAHLAPTTVGKTFLHFLLDWSVHFKSGQEILGIAPQGAAQRLVRTENEDELNTFQVLSPGPKLQK